MGQLVRTLENKRLDPGRYSTHWDGTNASGQRVSSGVYFYKMEAGQFGATKKMLVVK
jgi:flagellar hook assembly protein FlgD